MAKLLITKAKKEDAQLVFEFINLLAEYEEMLGDVRTSKEEIESVLFGEDPKAHCIIGRYNNQAVSFAVYFFNFSTFLGKHGLYLEDLFVLPEYRGKRIGKLMLKELAKIAVDNNCGRLEWSVLNWNESAIKFYKNLGAEPLSEWTTFRLAGKRLNDFASE